LFIHRLLPLRGGRVSKFGAQYQFADRIFLSICELYAEILPWEPKKLSSEVGTPLLTIE
jgi:hypothetical protein